MGKLREKFAWTEAKVKEKIRATTTLKAVVAAGGYDDLGEAAYPVIREMYGTLHEGDFDNLSEMGPWLSTHYDGFRDVVREELIKKGSVSCEEFWSDTKIKTKIKATDAFKALVQAQGYKGGIIRASAPVVEAIYGKVERKHFDTISDYLEFLWRHQRLIDELLTIVLKDDRFMRKWASGYSDLDARNYSPLAVR